MSIMMSKQRRGRKVVVFYVFQGLVLAIFKRTFEFLTFLRIGTSVAAMLVEFEKYESRS